MIWFSLRLRVLSVAFGSCGLGHEKLWNVFGRPNVGWKDVFVTHSFQKQYGENSFKHGSQAEQNLQFLIGLYGRTRFITSKGTAQRRLPGRARAGESTGLVQSECGRTSKDLWAAERRDSAVCIPSRGVNSPGICANVGKGDVQIKRFRVSCYHWNHSFYGSWWQCLSILLLWCYI